MKLKKWEAVAENYGYGKTEWFWLQKNAVIWLNEHSSFDILYLKNRRTNEKLFIKDRLFGQAKTPKATLIQHTNGIMEIKYNDKGEQHGISNQDE